MITIEFTEAEAQAAADAICAWATGVNYLGPADLEALHRASDKLTAAIDSRTTNAA